MKVKLEGLMNDVFAANSTPPNPAQHAPRAKALSFAVTLFMPMASQAISSSRRASLRAAQARITQAGNSHNGYNGQAKGHKVQQGECCRPWKASCRKNRGRECHQYQQGRPNLAYSGSLRAGPAPHYLATATKWGSRKGAALQYNPHNFAKAKGDNGKVVAPQAQHGEVEQHARQHGKQPANGQEGPKAYEFITKVKVATAYV